MTEQEAIEDLKQRVRELLANVVQDAMQRIDKIQASGVNIASDHIKMTASHGPYITPRNFVAAYTNALRDSVVPTRDSSVLYNRANRGSRSRYYLSM